MDPFKLTTLGKEIVCERYGFEENTIYRKSWIELFGDIAKKVMLDKDTLCTIVSKELTIDNLVQRFEKENLTGLRIQHIFKICDTTWLVELITMLNYINVNQVILIDTLQVNKISELKQIDSYCKRHDISLIIREQVPYSLLKRYNMSKFNPKTIKIGNTEWMTENLAYDDDGEGITYNPKNKEYYYTWQAAMRVADKLGWKLPSDKDWDKACEECGGVKNEHDSGINCSLKEKLGIKLSGYYDYGFYYIDICFSGRFWSSSEYSRSDAWYRYFDISSSVTRYSGNKTNGFSIRLVKDIK